MIAISLAVTFALLFAGTLALLIRSTKNSLQMIDKLDEFEERVSEALKVLSARHKTLEARSKTEIFFDDPVVKEVVKDISDCRDSVAQIIDIFEEK